MKTYKMRNGIIGFLTACCCFISGNGLPVAAENAVENFTVEESTGLESPEETQPPEEMELPSVTTAPIMAETTVETTETVWEGIDDETISLGDLDGDGTVAVEDAVFVLTIYARQSAGLEVDLSPQQFFCADCDHDTKISVEDAVLILEYYAKRSAGLPVGTFSEYVDEKSHPVTTTVTDPTLPSETSTETSETSIETTTEISTAITTTVPTTTITTTTTPTTSITTSTTSTTTSTTTTVTTTTITTTLPNAVKLPVACILQNDSPSLPTGCEATALTIALNYDGFSAEKTDIAKTYLPKMLFYTLNNIYYGADFQYVFPGDPTTSYGYGCYAPAIVATANAYFTAQKNASYAENISGTNFSDLLSYVANGRPVVFWATMGMCAPGTGGSWTTPDGDTVTWKSNEHCLVLTGYDKSAGTVEVADPLRGNVTYDMALVAQRYEQMGKNAVVLHSTTDSKTETEGIVNGGVYRLRNAGSGLYLTVADGMDADKTNVIQDTEKVSLSQLFRISYDTDRNAYRLYAMCSSDETNIDGTNRVLDIVKLGGGVVSGCNVEIYRPVDAPAQTFVLVPQADGTMMLSCSANRSTCLSVWNDEVGSSLGTGFYAYGNVVIRNDIGESTQRWILEMDEGFQ